MTADVPIIVLSRCIYQQNAFSALDTYEYTSGKLLDCPIYSLGGKKDGEQNMSYWAMESSSCKSETTIFPGGSFFWLDKDIEVSFDRVNGGSRSNRSDFIAKGL